MKQVQLAIIGGGPAGLSAAIAARKAGVEDILLIERDRELGGILNQCIHAGFGLQYLRPRNSPARSTPDEYVRQFRELNIPCLSGTMVLDLSPDRVLTVTGRETGLVQIRAQAVILAMGCRERPRGALNIPGTRPAGIYSAGAAQRLVNVEDLMPGRRCGDPGQRRYRPHHGPPHDAGGRPCPRRGGGHALFRRPEAEHRPVSGGLRYPPVPAPPPWWISTDGSGWRR